MMKYPYARAFWAPDDPPDIADSISGDEVADVVIIGAGFSGMSTAHHLKKAKPELDVVLLEAEYAGFGASGRNYGDLVAGVKELRGLSEDGMSEEEWRFLTKWVIGQVDDLEQRIREEGIDCELSESRIGAVDIAMDPAGWETLQALAELLDRRGTPNLLIPDDKLKDSMPVPFPTFGGLARTEWTSLNPWKLVRGLRASLIESGVRLYEKTRVVDIEISDPAVVRVEGGHKVTAPKLVVCAGAYIEQLPGMEGLIFPRHVWEVATEPLPDDVAEKIGYHEYTQVCDVGLAFYTSKLVNKQLIFGGANYSEAHLFRRSSLDESDDRLESEYDRIIEEMLKRWPFLADYKIEACWGGPIDVSPNYMPFIEKLPASDNIVVNVGYNGEGVVTANASGKMVKGLVLGTDHMDADAEKARSLFRR